MKLSDVAFVGCRLAAVYFAVQMLGSGPLVVASLADGSAWTSTHPVYAWAIIAFVCYLIAGLCLWGFAEPVAKAIVAGRTSSFDGAIFPEYPGRYTVRAIVAAAKLALGGYLMFGAWPLVAALRRFRGETEA
jgi:hypothetical protein